MVDTHDPSQREPDKLRVEAPEAPAPDCAAIKARIAERVRGDSGAGRLTTEAELAAITAELDLEALRAVLAEMGRDSGYADVKALVSPAGRVYLFSERHLAWIEAQDKARVEEARFAVVERIRADSSHILLTAAVDLEALLPFEEPGPRAAFLAEILADPRFADVRVVTGPKGETYYHSEWYVSGNYGAIMMRAKVNDPCWAIAEFVRHRSRVMPAPTNVATFQDPVFRLDPASLDGVVEKLLRTAEYADVKKLVHPETHAVYLYSTESMEERQAHSIMDWEEVGALRNP
jgi:hypothetical protein